MKPDLRIDPLVSVGSLLTEKNLTLAVAESCTGGLISNMITNAPGSSAYFDSAAICYSTESKIRLLGIPKKLTVKYGTVSPETAISMAGHVRKLLGTNVGLAITGIAGPASIENKPVGTVYIAMAYGKKAFVRKFRFKGSRQQIKKQAANAAMEFLWKSLRIFNS